MADSSIPRRGQPSTLYDPALGRVLAAAAPRRDATPLTLMARQLAYWSGSDRDRPRRPGRRDGALLFLPMRRADWLELFPTFRTKTVERSLDLGEELRVLRTRRDRHRAWVAVDLATLLRLFAAATLDVPDWIRLPEGGGVQLSADVEIETRDIGSLDPRLAKSGVSDSRNRESLTPRHTGLKTRYEEAGRPAPAYEEPGGESQELDPATLLFAEVADVPPEALRGLDSWATRYAAEGEPLEEIVEGLREAAVAADARDPVAYVVGMLRGAIEEGGSAARAYELLEARVRRTVDVGRTGYGFYFDRRR